MTSEVGNSTGEATTQERLTKLIAALLWDAEDFYSDIFERHLIDADGGSPDVDLVELTEHSPPRLSVIAGGNEYVVTVEPRSS